MQTTYPARTIAFAVVPRSTVNTIALVFGFAMLTALAAQIRIPIPGTPVPITGQTFAVRVNPESSGGPYLMLPVLGPSNIRDAIGRGVDFFIDPIGFATSTEIGLIRAGTDAVDERSRNIEDVRDLERNSLDFYATVRSLYRQRRAQQIRNDQVEPTEPAPTIGVDFPSISEGPPLE